MDRQTRALPPGCLAFLVVFGLAFLVPLFLAQVMLSAVARLGLPTHLALLALIGIFLGGAVNIPVKKLVREEQVVLDPFLLYGLGPMLSRLGFGPMFPALFRQRAYTIIAVNLGGCVIPCALAGYEIVRLVGYGLYETVITVVLTAVNVIVCYRLARPLPGVGIAMPALVPPLVAATGSVLAVPQFAPPVAFVAGVLGPLIGADLFHLKEVRAAATGVASIGGAGTFDGIVLSGMLAAFLA